MRISAAGFIHLRILSERLEYLYGVLPVTPIFETKTAQKIANVIEIENRNGTVGGYQMLNCVKELYKYLERQANRIRANFAEFGKEDSGTTYILKQIQNTIRHFEMPASSKGHQQPNLLDI